MSKRIHLQFLKRNEISNVMVLELIIHISFCSITSNEGDSSCLMKTNLHCISLAVGYL